MVAMVASASCQLIGGIDARSLGAGGDAGSDVRAGLDVDAQMHADAATSSADSGPASDALTEVGGGGADSGATAVDMGDAPSDSGTDPALEGSMEGRTDAGFTYRATVMSDSPLAYWRVGESSGTVAHDEITSNPGAAYLPTCALGHPGAIHGDPDTAVLLAGDGTSCVDTHDTTSLGFPGRAEFSIEAWIEPASIDVNDYRHVFVQETTDDNGKEGYGLFLTTGGLTFQRHVSGIPVSVNVLPPPVNLFTYVAATYDGSAIHVYVNGAEPNSSAADTRTMPVMVGGAYVGCSGGSIGFDGVLDEIAVYGSALTAAQVYAHYRAGKGS